MSGEASSAFRRSNYTVVRNAMDPASVHLVHQYYDLRLKEPGYFHSDLSGATGRYGDSLGEAVLTTLQPVLEQHTGYPLIPTYSYLRAYDPRARLHKHTDRPACEISATLTVGYEAPGIWPICVERDGRKIEVSLDRGDLLIYRGSLVPHWREKFHGSRWFQMFLHYVIDGGELAEYRYDQRSAIGVPGPAPSVAGPLRRRLMPVLAAPRRWRSRWRHRGYRRRVRGRPVASVDLAQYLEHTGMYKVGTFDVIKVFVYDGRLFVQRYGGPQSFGRIELTAAASDEFFSRDVDLEVRFRDGHLTLSAQGATLQAAKIDYS